MKPLRTLWPLALTACTLAHGQMTKQDVVARIEQSRPTYDKIALDIWSYAEVGYQETKSTKRLQDQLRAEGFEIRAGLVGEPTAFIASYGSGKPVIAIIGEFDALPGLSQEAGNPEHKSLGARAGHGCGHNTFGAGSAMAAAAVKAWMESTGQKGTLRYYGCPAEEGGSGKVYMVRAGLFNDVDAVLHWHPGDHNDADPVSNLANMSAKFRFNGTSGVASTPSVRSALKGIQVMDLAVNVMKDQMPYETVVQAVVTHGGEAPNVAPGFAESFYYSRNHDRRSMLKVFNMLADASKGAAIATGTKTNYEIIHGNFELLPNDTMARVMYANMVSVGGFTYTPEEKAFAEKLRETVLDTSRLPPLNITEKIKPYDPNPNPGTFSTDVGDVSWAAPTAGCNTAVIVPGTTVHSWQATAATGMSIGLKGMALASKTVALSAVDLYTHPEIIAKAHAEFEERRGPDFKYRPLLGDRSPPLDYRN
jgi:aminobenzoyl-glutamate utilization protein B